jgi:rhomboid protease GluP
MMSPVFNRKTTGSVVCPSCGSLVGVRDDRCYSCGRANPGMWGFAPVLRQLGADLGFVPLVIGGASIIYLLTLVLTILTAGPGAVMGGGSFMNILAPGNRALLLFGASGAYPVFVLGSWWTVLSASWLHGGLLHIVFNMMWIRNLGPTTAEVAGPARTIVIYTVAGACGFLLSSFMGAYGPALPFLRGAPFTVGASASIFGLLGALVHYGRTSGSSLIHAEAKRYALILFVFGLIMPGVDNFAHAGGFIGGYATSAFFNPLTRERGDHMLMAVGCLAVTFLAIAFSVFSGLALYR